LIQILSNRIITSILISVLIIFGYWLILDSIDISSFIKVLILLFNGILLNYFCYRYSILGQKNHLPLLIFSILSVLILPNLSYEDIIYGVVWLGSFFLAFEVRENPEKSSNYMIFLGILLGIAQAISNISILLFFPIFILFIQSGTRGIRGFFLSLLYFFMVLSAYIGILYVMEIPHKIFELIPSLSLDYSVFNTVLFKLFLPYVLISLIIHFARLNNYSFRYPNKTKILNFTLLIQAAIAVLLIILTAELDMIIYAVMSITVLLSFAFAYNKSNTFVNAAFASLIAIALVSLYLHKILIW